MSGDCTAGWSRTPHRARKRRSRRSSGRGCAASPLWAVKDPRLCWLAPLWLRTLAQCGIEPAILFVVRHPLEVAASLHARDGLSPGRSCLLWTRHLLAARGLATRGCVRAMVTYDQILQDWAGTMARVSHTLGVKWYRSAEEVQPDVEAFLDVGERHHRAQTAQSDAADGSGVLLPFVADLFHRCVQLSEDRGTWADLQNLGEEFGRVSAVYGALIEEFVGYTHSAERRAQHAEAILATEFPELDAPRRQFEAASPVLLAAAAEREMAVRSELTERLLSVDRGLEKTAHLLAEQAKAIAALEQQVTSMRRDSVLARLRGWLARSDA